MHFGKKAKLQRHHDAFLTEIAPRRSRLGGGSVSAFGAALAAALLEKISQKSAGRASFGRARRACSRLVDADAQAFAQVVLALRRKDGRKTTATLRRATAVQQNVLQHARALRSGARRLRSSIPNAYLSDLACAAAFARAAEEGARALIRANRAWEARLRKQGSRT